MTTPRLSEEGLLATCAALDAEIKRQKSCYKYDRENVTLGATDILAVTSALRDRLTAAGAEQEPCPLSATNVKCAYGFRHPCEVAACPRMPKASPPQSNDTLPDEIAEIERLYKTDEIFVKDAGPNAHIAWYRQWKDVGTLLRALRSTGLVDREALAQWVADWWAGKDAAVYASDKGFADALISSGIIQAAPTEADIAETLASTHGSWIDLARAIQALWRKPSNSR